MTSSHGELIKRDVIRKKVADGIKATEETLSVHPHAMNDECMNIVKKYLSPERINSDLYVAGIMIMYYGGMTLIEEEFEKFLLPSAMAGIFTTQIFKQLKTIDGVEQYIEMIQREMQEREKA